MLLSFAQLFCRQFLCRVLCFVLTVSFDANCKAPEDEFFTFTSPAFRLLGPFKVEEFKNGLLQEKIIYDGWMMELLDRAVRRKNLEEQKKRAHQSFIPVYDGLQPGPGHDHPVRDGKLMQAESAWTGRRCRATRRA